MGVGPDERGSKEGIGRSRGRGNQNQHYCVRKYAFSIKEKNTKRHRNGSTAKMVIRITNNKTLGITLNIILRQ